MDEATKGRLAQNEVIFRSINEQVLALEQRYGSPSGGFVCECADAACLESVLLGLDEYARIHADEHRFFVVPGHERPEIETIVEQHPNYLVVEKNVHVPQI